MKRSLESHSLSIPIEIWNLVVLHCKPTDASHLMQCAKSIYNETSTIRLSLFNEMRLKLWHVQRHDKGYYDTYSDFVCCCATEWEARSWHPSESRPLCKPRTVAQWLRGTPPIIITEKGQRGRHWEWIDPMERHLLKVTRLGVADTNEAHDGVICSSFHAG